MQTSKERIREAADRLHRARETNTPDEPVRTLLEPGDIAAAYAVQRINTERRLAAGARMIGRKVGLTTRTVQQQLGINECDSGVIFSDDVFREDEEIPAHRVIQPMVEGEIALVLERPLTGERPSVADVVRATAYCLPAIEVVDSRVRDWDIRIQDTIADNASAQFIVLGGRPVPLDRLDLELCGMLMERNGETVSIGIGAACLGNPLNAAAWLARRMVEEGLPLQAGDIVLTGALGPFAKVGRDDRVQVRIGGLGTVRTQFGAA